jgi:hypothetical protein
MIESVHSDDEPEGNGDNSDGSHDDTPSHQLSVDGVLRGTIFRSTSA